MSKTPLITKNDGTSWADAVPKLRTDELGASSTDWVQEDDTKADTLKVTANGTYPASSAGKYGYDYVAVSVKGGSATGIGPDGNEHTVYPDPETGKLVDEVIPSSIVVTTPPTVTTYQDGDTIDFTGIVVTAYKADGTVWSDADHPNGVIPVSELEFPVTTAHLYGYDYYSKDGINAERFVCSIQKPLSPDPSSNTTYVASNTIAPGCNVSGHLGTVIWLTIYEDDLYVYLEPTQERSVAYWAKNAPPTLTGSDGWVASSAYSQITTQQWTKDGTVKSAYAVKYGITEFTIPVSTANPKQATALPSAQNSIPVNWQRPGDGAILEATFTIDVTPAST